MWKMKIMKRLLVSVVLMVIAQVMQAQTWAEWTQQKETQKKYLIQQIAALQVYLGYAKTGYDIANKGLTVIGKIKKGDFDLHDQFFASFRYTKPAIASSPKVAAIIARQIQILKETSKTLTGVDATDALTPEEKSGAKKTFENLLISCTEVLNELLLLTSSTELSLKDDERLKRIDALYQDMESKAAFCFSYSTELGLVATQRLSEKVEIRFSREIK